METHITKPMNNTIKHLDNGDFEVEQPSGEVVPVEVKDTCQCLNAKPIMKCSENGVSAYCGGCSKGFKSE